MVTSERVSDEHAPVIVIKITSVINISCFKPFAVFSFDMLARNETDKMKNVRDRRLSANAFTVILVSHIFAIFLELITPNE